VLTYFALVPQHRPDYTEREREREREKDSVGGEGLGKENERSDIE